MRNERKNNEIDTIQSIFLEFLCDTLSFDQYNKMCNVYIDV